MLFDKLCGIVERPDELHGPTRGERLPQALLTALKELRSVAENANIFQFEGISEGSIDGELRASILRENPALLGDRFFLPFRTIAVESKVDCTILKDLVPDAVGSGAWRFFVSISPLVEREDFAHIPRDAVAVSWGKVTDVVLCMNPPRTEATYDIGGAILANKKGVFFWRLGADAEDYVRPAVDAALVALEVVAYCNMPSRWVVEIRTSQSGEEAGRGRLRRSNQRPLFTTLTPEGIKRLFGKERDEERQSPTPHQRRRHTRTFRSERFAKSGKQGKTIIIPATWVGDTEAVVGGKKYIVRTDL